MLSKKLIISCGFSELLSVKNIAGVIRGVPKNFELWIVGDGKERQNLEKLSKSLKVKTKFWGRVDNKKAREIMRKSDVFVLNSFHEGMPHALIEALAEGVLVVATKIPAVLEVLDDRKTGVLVNVDDPKDLQNGIILSQKLKPQLINNGKKLYKEKFTWEAHLKGLYNVFDEVTFGSFSGNPN